MNRLQIKIDSKTMNQGDLLTERVKKHTQSQVVIEEEDFTYSDNGHITSRVLTTGGNDYTTSYQYDVGGNLKQVTLPDNATITYQYDAYGNRVKKQTSTEKVSYEYAGGSCQREIHRNLSDTILYTLRYYPWGFTKTVPGTPDVTTTYYYLVDTRGWVWGLTDGDGIILETYQYSPYGELLSTPTITHSRFLSGADECLWDSETGLYYLHARYYDPQLGRFIQEDIVEGDLESPASQNRYTYCQNDPVSLIDPSGYSPQNTNTPARISQFNIANLDSPYGCSLSDLQPVLPALTPSDGGEVIGPEEMFVYDSCNQVCRKIGGSGEESWKNYITDEEDVYGANGELIETRYKVKINGREIVITEKQENGRKHLHAYPGMVSSDSKDAKLDDAICAGLNAAFDDLFNDPTISNQQINSIDTNKFLNDIAGFTSKNYNTFSHISNEGISMFIKHAAKGTFASYYMSQVGINEEARYNQIIGFWTSYFAERAANKMIAMGKTPQKIYMFDHSGKDSNGKDANILGLIGIGNMTKVIANAEHGSEGELETDIFQFEGSVSDTHLKDNSYGIMNLNESEDRWYGDAIDKEGNGPASWIFQGLTFGKANWKSDAFVNIGGAVGYLFSNARMRTLPGTGFHTTLSEGNWLEAAYWYNYDPGYIKKINAGWKMFNRIR